LFRNKKESENSNAHNSLTKERDVSQDCLDLWMKRLVGGCLMLKLQKHTALSPLNASVFGTRFIKFDMLKAARA